MDAETMKAEVVGVFDRASASYDRVGDEFFGLFGRRLVEHAAVQAGEKVLDLGCGRGAVLFPAAEAAGPTGRVIGIDLAPGMVAATAEEAINRGLTQIQVRFGDAEWPDGEAAPYDLICAGFVLFFLPDLPAAVGRYASILRSGGRLAFSWFGDDDARWNEVYEAAWSHLPEERRKPDHRAGDSPWRGIASVEAALTNAGYISVTTVEEEHLVVFQDADQWYAWTWSHGMRYRWEAMSKSQRAAARRDAEAAMGGVRRADGCLEGITRVRYTVAQKP
jgi:ubiquinone/menaquinone biosynthesis C-methylase UbiE